MATSINWGRGRLLPYESLTSFAAKFCVLNEIAPSRFRKFLTAKFGRQFDGDVPSDETETVRLAELLDEPYHVVATLNNRLFISSKRSLVGIRLYHDDLRNEIKICDACLSRGVHLVFAEVPWLKKCPIHRITYSIRRVEWKPGTIRFDNYVREIAKLLRNANQKWPFPPRLKTDQYYDSEESSNLIEFVNWLNLANATKQWIDRHLIWASGSCDVMRQTQWISLGKVISLCPTPPAIREVLHDSIEQLKICVFEYDKDVYTAWEQVAVPISVYDLVYHYKRAAELNRKEALFQRRLHECVEAIRSSHPVCACSWGWSRYLGWQEVDSSNWPHWGFICPYEVAANELISGWGDFTDVMSTQDTKREFIKIGAARRQCAGTRFMSQSGEASHVDYSAHSSNSATHLIPCHLEEMLDRLVAREIQIYTEELQNWLVSLTLGAKPYTRSTLIGNVMLLSVGDKMTLLSWTSARNG